MRCLPTRASAHGMSLVAWVGCIDAIAVRLHHARHVLGAMTCSVLDAQPAVAGVLASAAR